MALPELEPGLAVAAQLTPADLPRLAAAGFRSLICNRPDGEAEGQASAGSIAAAAAALGMDFVLNPVIGSAIDEAAITIQRQALDQLPRPILAYCRSGNRCTVLWALAHASERPVDSLIAIAKSAGYDLEPLRARLQARACGET